ncbi:hypothetical protein M8C13_13960 [Crossiella sp. SN42]|uniref:hypothetical protein n=1 Tax=Crossiella sp. SN42 TaxID=2944808 RepID=UPI00207C8F8F|nr:hypothetical protein [Crossiella sp. SN42]MCO1576859.1 hypothetical protein [Crossiella sp. SN42]
MLTTAPGAAAITGGLPELELMIGYTLGERQAMAFDLPGELVRLVPPAVISPARDAPGR